MARSRIQQRQSNQPTQAPQNKIVSQHWNGPLPPPAALADFDRIIPNGAERIMAMVETEQAHRIEYESKRLEALTSDTIRGQYIGMGISILALVGAGVTAWMGAHPTVSIALVSLPVLGIIKALISSRSSEQKP